MDWTAFALLCALFTSVTDLLSKALLRHADEYIVGWLKPTIAAPFFLIVLFSMSEKPHLSADFWRTMAFLLPLELTAYILYLKALKSSPLSLTVPFLAFTPVFSLLTAFIMLRETVTIFGGIGIVSVAAGSYLLNLDLISKGPLEPVRAVFKEKGSRYMMIVAFIFSFTAVLGKIAMKFSSIHFFPAFYYVLLSVVMLPLVLFRGMTGRSRFVFKRADAGLYAVLGCVFFFSVFAHFFAIAGTNVAYMISIKRLSLLLGVIYGGMIFKESKIGIRFAATALMVVGALLIVTAN